MTSSKEEALGWFKSILMENFDIDEEELVVEASIEDDLDLGAGDVSDILFLIEEILGLVIDHRDYDKWETYGDMVNTISEQYE